MTATADEIARVRRMVAEPTVDTYTDDAIEAVIELYPMTDEFGQEPYVWTVDDGLPTRTNNEFWAPTYDLYAAAAEIWQEKAGLLVDHTDFSADGGNYSDSQKYDQAMKQVKFYLARRSARPIKLVKWPPERNGLNESDFV